MTCVCRKDIYESMNEPSKIQSQCPRNILRETGLEWDHCLENGNLISCTVTLKAAGSWGLPGHRNEVP